MSKKIFWMYASIILPCLAIILILAGMMFVANSVRQSYSQPNQPDAAYMIQMFESGLTISEQQMCAADNDCVLFRTQMSMFRVGYIEIAGKHYSNQSVSVHVTNLTRGIYCPGEIGIHSCFEIVVLAPRETCPAEVIYLGLKSPMVPNSCLEKQ